MLLGWRPCCFSPLKNRVRRQRRTGQCGMAGMLPMAALEHRTGPSSGFDFSARVWRLEQLRCCRPGDALENQGGTVKASGTIRAPILHSDPTSYSFRSILAWYGRLPAPATPGAFGYGTRAFGLDGTVTVDCNRASPCTQDQDAAVMGHGDRQGRDCSSDDRAAGRRRTHPSEEPLGRV